jgi:hypothetical protein
LTAIDPATNGHDDLTSEVTAYIAQCCTRMEPIRGTFFKSRGEVTSGGTVDVEVRRINFDGDDLTISVSLRPIKLVIVRPEEEEQRELPAGSSALGLPGGAS